MTNEIEARPAASPDAPHYTISVEEAATRYTEAGVPRTIRRIQKYCARGDIDCKKIETNFGEKYFISMESIDRHIAQIRDAEGATGRVQPRPDASERSLQTDNILVEEAATPPDARTRPDAPGRDYKEIYIQQLETENAFLRSQSVVLLDRVKETNVLTQGLQRLLSPLLGKGKVEDDDSTQP